jgi:phage shock protein E
MKNVFKIFLFVFFIAIIGIVIVAQNKINISKSATILNTNQATNNEIFYVDVRTPIEFAQGSVKCATNIPLDQIENQLYKFKNKKNIVVFCRSGNRSSQAKIILEHNGFTNVINGGSWEDVNSRFMK